MPTSPGEGGKIWEIDSLSTCEEIWGNPLPEMHERRVREVW